MVAVTPCCSVEKGLGEKVQVSSPQGRRSVLTLCLVLNYCNQVLSRLRDVCYLQKTSPGVLTAENSLPLCVTFACNLIKSPQKPYWLSEWDVKGKKKKSHFLKREKGRKKKNNCSILYQFLSILFKKTLSKYVCLFQAWKGASDLLFLIPVPSWRSHSRSMVRSPLHGNAEFYGPFPSLLSLQPLPSEALWTKDSFK